MTHALHDLFGTDEFVGRHIGPRPDDLRHMLDVVDAASVDELIDEAVPAPIRMSEPLALPGPRTETDVLSELRSLAERNATVTSMIGMGYYGTVTPPVIKRNVLENPAWYTAYTPYQPEISQGRLEAAAQLPDDGRRPDRARHRQCLAARRGHGRRRGHGDGPPDHPWCRPTRFFVASRRTSSDARGAAHPRRARRASSWSSATSISSTATGSSARCSATRPRPVRSPTGPTRSSAPMRSGPRRSWRPTCSRAY